MVNKIALNITDFFIQKGVVQEEESELCTYGVELMISGIMNVFVILFTGLIIHKVFLSIVFLVIMMSLRLFTGGYHSDTNIGCNIVFVITFIFSVIMMNISNNYNLDKVIWMMISVGIIIVAKISPVKNSNKIVSVEEKGRYKTISLVMYSVFSGMAIFMYIISGIVGEQYQSQIHMLSLYINITLLIIVVMMIVGVWKEERRDV